MKNFTLKSLAIKSPQLRAMDYFSSINKIIVSLCIKRVYDCQGESE